MSEPGSLEKDLINRLAAACVFAILAHASEALSGSDAKREKAKEAWHAWNVYEDSLSSLEERVAARRRLNDEIADLALKQALGSHAERSSDIKR